MERRCLGRKASGFQKANKTGGTSEGSSTYRGVAVTANEKKTWPERHFILYPWSYFLAFRKRA